LASAGLGSRRSCEELILEGRVEVDGEIVTELGTRVDVNTQRVRVDGELLKTKRLTYYAVNKPVGVVSTNRDPAARMRVVDLVPDGDEMFTVGRLDKSSSGLILVTNDGDLANGLAHPRYQVEKTYKVVVAGHPGPDDLQKLRQGIHLAEGPVRVTSVRVKARQKNNTVLHMVLREGRNREIRRMAAKIGHKVRQLERIAIGPLRLGEMPSGAYRELTADELKALRRRVSNPTRPQRSAKPRRSPPAKSTRAPRKRRTKTQR
jgi:23S rRNA pseudouridine2605 synthase